MTHADDMDDREDEPRDRYGADEDEDEDEAEEDEGYWEDMQ